MSDLTQSYEKIKVLWIQRDLATSARIEELVKERDDYAHKLMASSNTYTEMHIEIECLSGKLAKAMAGLREIVSNQGYMDDPWGHALALLAELEGRK
jgi:hypothetical protein